MELVGDFRSTDPIFKGCYGDSFLYSDVDLGQLRWCGIHLPPYQGEILAPPAPSYLQAKQSEATEWSPPWATTSNQAVESPKTKHSGGRVDITIALDMALTHPHQSALTPPQQRSPPIPRSQHQRNRTNLPRVTVLASMDVPPSHLLSQPDVSRKRPTQKTPMNSTPPFPLAPMGLMAFVVHWDPTARQPSSSLPPSP